MRKRVIPAQAGIHELSNNDWTTGILDPGLRRGDNEMTRFRDKEEVFLRL